MKKFDRSLGFLLLNFSLVLLGSRSVNAAEGPSGVTCHVPTSPIYLNPQLSPEPTIGLLVLGRLVTETPDGKPTPNLAESWVESVDGLQLTMKLRRGVRFQTTEYFKPTREFQAEDVVFSFDRQRLSTHPFFQLSGGKYPSFDGSPVSKQLTEVQKISPYQVRFVFKERVPNLMHEMAKPFGAILSAEYAETLLAKGHSELLDTRPVGTGPYQVVRLFPGKRLELKAHAAHWSGVWKPTLLQIEFSALAPGAIEPAECAPILRRL